MMTSLLAWLCEWWFVAWKALVLWLLASAALGMLAGRFIEVGAGDTHCTCGLARGEVPRGPVGLCRRCLERRNG